MMIKNLLLALAFLPIVAIGQKKVEVIDFEYPISDDKTYNQSKEITLKKAKEEALRKAGIGESINSWEMLTQSKVNSDFTKIFNSDILTNIQGFIESWEYIKEPQRINKNNLPYIQLSIRAKVKKYDSKIDPKFVAKVEGINDRYTSNINDDDDKKLKIKIIPEQNCFLKVFYINDDEAMFIYPIEVAQGVKSNSVFENKMLMAKAIKELNYISPYTEKEIEHGKLIFVFTKEDFPFPYATLDKDGEYYTNTYVEKIFQWYMSIEPSMKFILYKHFSILR